MYDIIGLLVDGASCCVVVVVIVVVVVALMILLLKTLARACLVMFGCCSAGTAVSRDGCGGALGVCSASNYTPWWSDLLQRADHTTADSDLNHADVILANAAVLTPRRLSPAFGADEMELLLLLLRHSGYQLRSDDPQALKQIIALVKEKFTAATADSTADADADADAGTAVAPGVNGTSSNGSLAEEAGRWKAAFGARASSSPSSPSQPGDYDNGSTNAVVGGSRARYILDTILELQSNKRSRIQEQGQESGRRVRKWLGSVKAAKGGGSGGGDASLRVTWAELVSTESKGRWWRVGAAWAGRGGSSSSSSSAATPGNGGGAAVGMATGGATSAGSGTGGGDANGDEDGGEAGGLLALAARQRMNTDVRRSVFVAIVGSSDCEDALEKILRLNLKGAQEREIARVIVECCSQEASYNPYYAHLAERVCDRQPKLR